MEETYKASFSVLTETWKFLSAPSILSQPISETEAQGQIRAWFSELKIPKYFDRMSLISSVLILTSI